MSELHRMTMWIGSLMMLSAIPVMAVMGWFLGQRPDVGPFPLRAGQSVALPDPGLSPDELALYGRQRSPDFYDQAELGCELRDAGGTPQDSILISDIGAVFASPTVVEGTQLDPLLVFEVVDEGWTLTCTGDAVRSAAPVYVIASDANVSGARMVTWGMIPIFLIIGGIGALVFRPVPPSRLPVFPPTSDPTFPPPPSPRPPTDDPYRPR